jgi:hypothetical protein
MKGAGASVPVDTLWRDWSAAVCLIAGAISTVLFAFVVAMDPYGLLPSARAAPRPLMDINQRYMYPQVIRSGRFDAAILGTSTLRLVDPQRLSRETGAAFANLAMNAATPWEQVQLAGLFIRRIPQPRAVIWGLETSWCEADATTPAKRLTPRPFPPWLYDEPGWLDTLRTFNFTSLEIAVRMAGYRLGARGERIRRDGFEIFTPPDETYDPARAALHLYNAHGGIKPDLTPIVPAVKLDAAEIERLQFPALTWLDDTLSNLPAEARRILVLSPTHVASQPRSGSRHDAKDRLCKQRIAEIAARRNAILVDYRIPSEITTKDDNFWDPAHYRLPIAGRIETLLGKLVSREISTNMSAKLDPAADITMPASR